MGKDTGISWTDHSFNPWRGCTKVSAGCTHCYAETMSGRNPSVLGIWGKNGTREGAAESYWKQPVKWNKDAAAAGVRRRVFCASLADVFEGRESMPEESWADVEAARVRLFELIDATPHLDWLLLTKRPQNIPAMLPADWGDGWHNVWLGTSVENQAEAERRIPLLLAVPAVVRFLSCEPLLEPVDLRKWLAAWHATNVDGSKYYPLINGEDLKNPAYQPAIIHSHPRISWVIAGGESGAGARPMHPDWPRGLRDQCEAAGVAFFFKQHGEYMDAEQADRSGRDDVLMNERGRTVYLSGRSEPGQCGMALDGSAMMWKVGKNAPGHDVLDGQTWQQFPVVEL